jgi:protein SCO1
LNPSFIWRKESLQSPKETGMALDRTAALVGGAALATLILATVLVLKPWQSDPFAKCRASVVSGGAGSVGGPFTLTDETGKQVTDADVLTQPSLVYFGYTFCPDVCPIDVARNAEAVDALDARGYTVTPIFISLDPARDTPERLKEWTGYMHPRMLGLTGSREELDKAAKEYRVLYQLPDDMTTPDYTIGHSRLTYLMLPKTGFAEFFSGEESAEVMADRVACFLDAS